MDNATAQAEPVPQAEAGDSADTPFERLRARARVGQLDVKLLAKGMPDLRSPRGASAAPEAPKPALPPKGEGKKRASGPRNWLRDAPVQGYPGRFIDESAKEAE